MGVITIVEAGSNQNNVTGAGTTYAPAWNTVLVDSGSNFSSNQVDLSGNTYWADIGCFLSLSGLTGLNTRLKVTLYTSNGDIDLYDGNPSGFINIGGTLKIEANRMLYLNSNSDSPFYIYPKITVSGGLTDAVDILTDSSFYCNLNP